MWNRSPERGKVVVTYGELELIHSESNSLLAASYMDILIINSVCLLLYFEFKNPL